MSIKGETVFSVVVDEVAWPSPAKWRELKMDQPTHVKCEGCGEMLHIYEGHFCAKDLPGGKR